MSHCAEIEPDSAERPAGGARKPQLRRRDRVRQTLYAGLTHRREKDDELDEEGGSPAQAREEILIEGSTDDAPASVESPASIRSRHIVDAIALNTMRILPSFLVSAMSETIRSELHLDEAVLGFAFSGYRLVACVAAYPMAVLADRWGAVRALRAAGLGAFALSLVFTWAAHSGAGLVLALAVVGLAPALATPAVNVVITSGVRVQRRALAFAAASASPVAALMVAGATAPVLEELLGGGLPSASGVWPPR